MKPKGDNRPSVSVDYVAALLQLADSHGIAKEKLLAGSRIPLTALHQPGTYVTVSQYRNVFKNAVKLLNDPAIGLRFGLQQNITIHGSLGFAIISSSSFRHAAQLACKYVKTRNRLVRLKFMREAQFVIFQHDLSLAPGALYRFMVEQAFSGYALFLESHLGRFKGSVLLNYPEPDYGDLYRNIFQDVTFNAKYNQIRFPVDLFRKQVVMGNPTLVKIAEKQCEILLAQMDQDNNFPQKIHDLLIKTPGFFPTQEEVARQLKLSKRTLSRRLDQYGTSYQKIIRKVRQELAIHYLTSTNWTIEDIADMLDYESASNFGRAFKRWTGIPPGVYRKSKPASP